MRDFLRKHMIPRPEIEWNVILDVTTGCNLGCPFCFNSPTAAQNTAPYGLLHKIKRNVMPYAVDLALGCRHAPMLHPELDTWLNELDAARRTDSDEFAIGMLTSGTLLEDATMPALIDSGLDRLQLSIDTTHPETFAKLRTPATWPELREKLRGCLQRARQSSMKVGVQALILQATVPHLVESMVTLADMGIDSFSYNQMNPLWSRLEPAWWDEGRNTELVETVAALEEKGRELGVHVRLPSQAPPPEPGCTYPLLDDGTIWDEHRLNESRQVICAAPWAKVRIDYRGFVFPCPQILHPRHSWGNVRDARLPELVSSAPAVAMRRELLAGRSPNRICRKCPFGPNGCGEE